MDIFHHIEQLKNTLFILRQEKKSIGFVPTMGALHAGHLSLIEKSKKDNDITVCSIFVNPTQFNDPNDLKNYPRTWDTDTQMLEAAGNNILFAPSVAEMYPEKTSSAPQIDFGQLDKVMEGAHRPGHFNGVVTIVGKLFDIVQPDKAYFGQKDFQQLAIIKHFVKQQQIPVEIIGCPIIREKDGLAMSSRNTLLSVEQRQQAQIISQTLFKIQEQFPSQTINELKQLVSKKIASAPMAELEYFEIVDPDSLLPVNDLKKSRSIACIAVRMGNIRLIDNVLLDPVSFSGIPDKQLSYQ